MTAAGVYVEIREAVAESPYPPVVAEIYRCPDVPIKPADMCVADLHRLRGCFQPVSFRKVKQGIPERDSESDSRFGLKPQTQGIVVPVEQVWSADGQCWLESSQSIS